ncbi:LysR family transcriptional regulator [Klebsiella variicola subsp. variicola]|nr:LysR family transcriptional regulator [Klebsiella variicola subsp. variicola]
MLKRCESAEPWFGLHIKALEEHLGVRLLNRTTRRQSLTDFGQGYYQSCRRILADIEDSESQAFALHQKPAWKTESRLPSLLWCPCAFACYCSVSY